MVGGDITKLFGCSLLLRNLRAWSVIVRKMIQEKNFSVRIYLFMYTGILAYSRLPCANLRTGI